MITVSGQRIAEAIGLSRRIVAGPGCGSPTTLLEIVGQHSPLLLGSMLYSGLLLNDYPFLDAVIRGDIGYATWHVTQPVRRLVADDTVPFYPVRASQVPALLAHLKPDVALVRVSPPDRHGFCNLGPSVSYMLPAVRLASQVIAEIDPTVPRTRGESAIHVSQIALAVESTTPLPEYPRPSTDDVSRAIAKHVISLLPPNPTLQIGIGAIPEAMLEQLLTEKIGNLRFVGMAVDGVVELYEAGLVQRTDFVPYPPIMAAELMGTRRLMDFAHENPALGVYGTPVGINASSLSAIDRFVSVNSGIQVDRTGQTNSEWAGGNQLSGVGGAADFVDSAMLSSGGLRILALPAVNLRDQSSKIVHALPADTPVTVPRHSIDYVITENGIARLGFASLRERAEMLAGIAEPGHRSEILSEAVNR